MKEEMLQLCAKQGITTSSKNKLNHQNEIHNNTYLQNEESAVLFGKHLSSSHTKLPSYPQYESTIIDGRHPHHEDMNLILQHSTERFTYVRG